MPAAFNLNLRHLRMLLAIADSGSLSVAARKIGISQPALSQALSKVELAFGVSLFRRTALGVTATRDGRRVLGRVGQAISHFGNALRSVGPRPRRDDLIRYLTIAHVRAIVSLSEAGSYVRAAKQAAVSAPAVHRAVQDLEQLCAVPLVDRRGRGVGLTSAGGKILRGFMLGLAELTRALDESSGGGRRIAIGAMALSRSLILPATLANVLQDEPDAIVDVIEGSYLELAESLRSGRIDVLIGALREHPGRDLVQEPLFTDRLTIVGRSEHPLAGRIAGFADLADYPWIVARRASGLLEQWQQMFDQADMPRPRAPIHCGSVALIRGLLVRSDFLTLLSPDQIRAEVEAGLIVPISSCIPDTERTIGAIMRRDWHPTAFQTRFMDILRSRARQHRDEPGQ